MAVETTHPNSYVVPAVGLSGGACASPTATSASCSAISQCINPSNCNVCVFSRASVEFYNWDTMAYQAAYTALTLKVSWSTSACSGTCDDVTRKIYIDYSTDGGSNWTTFSGFPKDCASSSGTASATLSVSITESQLRVRAYSIALCGNADGTCDCCSTCTCGVTGTINDVYAEGTYAKGACCSGTSCTLRPQFNCSGTYQGDGTVCDPNPCGGGGGGSPSTNPWIAFFG